MVVVVEEEEVVVVVVEEEEEEEKEERSASFKILRGKRVYGVCIRVYEGVMQDIQGYTLLHPKP